MNERAAMLQQIGWLGYQFPQLRLGQLLVLAASVKHSFACPELYYMKDEDLLEALNKLENDLIAPKEPKENES